MTAIAMGHQLSPNMCLVIGIGIMLFGMIGMGRSFRKNANFRWGDKGGGRARMSRASHFIFHAYFAIFGVLMAGNNYFPHPLPVLLLAFAIVIGAAACDAFNDWRKRGFPIRTRCPHCKKGFEFRIVHGCCPHCKMSLPSAHAK